MSAGYSATPQAQWPAHIRARYGVDRRRSWLPYAIAGAGFAFLLLVLGFGWRAANPRIDAAVVGYNTVSDSRLDLSFEVARRDSVAVTCVIRARAQDGFDVGYALVSLPAATGKRRFEYSLATAYRGLVGELLGCGQGGPPPGVAGAQFRPAVLPPPQPWSSARVSG